MAFGDCGALRTVSADRARPARVPLGARRLTCRWTHRADIGPSQARREIINTSGFDFR
jgi:hypothetical protein